MKEDLLRYVQDGEPPMGLSADSLISKGRSQRRWRLGAGLGTGTVAMGLALAGVFSLTPAGGSGPVGFGSPSPAACALPLAMPLSPEPSPSPSSGSSGTPAPQVSDFTTTLVLPSDTSSISPGAGSASPDPTPTAVPSDGKIRPSAVSGGEKAHALTCVLVKAMSAHLPTATFGPVFYSTPPMAANMMINPQTGMVSSYEAGAAIFLDGKHHSLHIVFNHDPKDGGPTGASVLNDGMTAVEIRTGTTYIIFTASAGSPFTGEYLLELGNREELDVFK